MERQQDWGEAMIAEWFPDHEQQMKDARDALLTRAERAASSVLVSKGSSGSSGSPGVKGGQGVLGVLESKEDSIKMPGIRKHDAAAASSVQGVLVVLGSEEEEEEEDYSYVPSQQAIYEMGLARSNRSAESAEEEEIWEVSPPGISKEGGHDVEEEEEEEEVGPFVRGQRIMDFSDAESAEDRCGFAEEAEAEEDEEDEEEDEEDEEESKEDSIGRPSIGMQSAFANLQSRHDAAVASSVQGVLGVLESKEDSIGEPDNKKARSTLGRTEEETAASEKGTTALHEDSHR